jgi:phage-related minor tail protein
VSAGRDRLAALEARLAHVEAQVGDVSGGAVAALRALAADVLRLEEAVAELQRDREHLSTSTAAAAARIETAALEHARAIENETSEELRARQAIAETNRELREHVDVIFARVALMSQTVEALRWRLEPRDKTDRAESA